MKKILLYIIVFFCSPLKGQVTFCEVCSNGIDDDGNGLIDCQDPLCDCDNKKAITLCFIANSKCLGSDCGYTFDGNRMLDFSTSKLNNNLNFGVNGIVPCEITLVPLKTITPSKIDSIGCNIFFIGGFGGTACSGLIENQISNEELEVIKSWSLLNEKNLAIVTQANAISWGYVPSTVNTNPNLPTKEGLSSLVFNGPFGTINSFNQGGCYQGGFSGFPSTGMLKIATDSSPNPLVTLAIDTKTMDIIVGDVDIFTDLGGISSGDKIVNNNDVLFANIIALACKLTEKEVCNNGIDDDADGLIDNSDEECQLKNVKKIDSVLCSGQSYILNNKTYSETGIYKISIPGGSSAGCDSIIVLNLIVLQSKQSKIRTQICEGQKIAIGKTEFMKTGVYEILLPNGSTTGCDSTIILDLTVIPSIKSQIEKQICEGEKITIGKTEFTKTGVYEVIIPNVSSGCDSIITLDLIVNPIGKLKILKRLCEGEEFIYRGNKYSKPGVYELLKATNNHPKCDSLITIEISLAKQGASIVKAEICEGEVYTFGDFRYSKPGDYEISIKNGSVNGCDSIIIIQLEECLKIYVPNSFSPNQDGINDKVGVFSNSQVKNVEEFIIYDRWGNEIYIAKNFPPNSPEYAWNGYRKDKMMDPGVYLYCLKIQTRNGQFKIFKGDISLLK